MHCYRCGHVWRARVRSVRLCARCKSPYFWLPKPRVPGYGGGLGITEVVGKKRGRVLQLAHRWGATNVRVFGSVARSQGEPGSDLDLLVDRIPGRQFRRVELTMALHKLLGRRVDVVPEDGLFWLVQPNVVAEAVPL